MTAPLWSDIEPVTVPRSLCANNVETPAKSTEKTISRRPIIPLLKSNSFVDKSENRASKIRNSTKEFNYKCVQLSCPSMMLRSILLFIAAGLCEIGGGYLVWQWWRNGSGFIVGVLGGLILFL